MIRGLQHVLERRSINLLPNFVLIIIWCDNMHIDGDIWDFDHEIGHAENPTVDTGRALDFEQFDDEIVLEPDYVHVFDDTRGSGAKSGEIEVVYAVFAESVSVVRAVFVVRGDVYVVAVSQTELDE